MENERKTLTAMRQLYCHDHHAGGTSHARNAATLQSMPIAARGLPFSNGQATCGHCRIHCYRAEARAAIQEIMRYSGPRMLWRHPLLAIRHMRDSLRKSPPLPVRDSGKKQR